MTLTVSAPQPSEIHSPEFIAKFLRRQTNLRHFLVAWRDGRQIVFQIQPDPDVMTGVMREADERMRRGPTRVGPREDPVPKHVRRLRGQLRTCVRDLKLGGTEFLLCSKIEEQPAEYAYAIHVPQRSVRADIAALFERTIQDQLAGFREQMSRAAKAEADARTGHPVDRPLSNPASAGETAKAQTSGHRCVGRKRCGVGRSKRRQATK